MSDTGIRRGTRAASARSGRRAVNYFALWALQAWLALMFAMSGFAKVGGDAAMVEMFATIGIGQWFRYLVGALEVTDGIEGALEEAKAAAGDKYVAVMGAEVGQQYIRAGLIDEISIHLVPLLFGEGTRMFEYLGSEHIQLETAGVIETTEATHLRFRVVE
jgi:hypothetical protein